MSGVEVLGVVAAATQLAEYALKIVSSIAREYTKHQRFSERVQSHQINFQDLIGIAGHIQQNTALHTRFISEKLNDTLYEAERLFVLLSQECSDPARRSIKKYWVWIGFNAEDVISEGLKRLEEQKISLHLRISVTQAGISSENTILLKGIQESLTSLSDMPSKRGLPFTMDRPNRSTHKEQYDQHRGLVLYNDDSHQLRGSNDRNMTRIKTDDDSHQLRGSSDRYMTRIKTDDDSHQLRGSSDRYMTRIKTDNEPRVENHKNTGTKSFTTNEPKRGHTFEDIVAEAHFMRMGDVGEPSEHARSHNYKSIRGKFGISHLGDDRSDGSWVTKIIDKVKGPFDKKSK